MKLSTANGIRTFLINISKHCKNNKCDKCPYELKVNSVGIGCYFDIMPRNWDIEHILECYKGGEEIMNKNLMPEVAELLGVELGERFKIQRLDGVNGMTEAYFDEGNLHILDVYLNNGDVDRYLAKLLMGKIKIEKLPWEPKENEQFYRPNIISKAVSNGLWSGSTLEYSLKALGMVYRTKEEAEANLSKDYEKLTGKPLSSR